jgi:hypothetical protein
MESEKDSVIILEEGDDQPCMKCGGRFLDTGWECDDCGYDNRDWYYPEWRNNQTAT